MTLYYTVRGQVRIAIFSYIEDILTAFNKEYMKGKGTDSSAAPNSIFVLNKECKKLGQEKVMEFHNIVSKTLYSTKR